MSHFPALVRQNNFLVCLLNMASKYIFCLVYTAKSVLEKNNMLTLFQLMFFIEREVLAVLSHVLISVILSIRGSSAK